tara:strand:+ start:389960 stop:390235 length:276 start_codon:yes stop_codon:yes gene_type:complete
MEAWMLAVSVITIVLAIVGSTGGAVWKMGRMVMAFENRIVNIERDQQDNYTMTAACEHALRTAINNPSMTVMDPRNPSKPIQVGPDARRSA